MRGSIRAAESVRELAHAMSGQRRPFSRECGMTLAELMTVLVIVGILAAIAIPNMQRTVQQGYWQHAQYILQLIHNGEQRYSDKENSYYLGSLSTMNDWRKLYMDNPNLPNFPVSYAVAPTATTFTATATNTSTSQTMTIDQDGKLCADPSVPPNLCGNWPKP